MIGLAPQNPASYRGYPNTDETPQTMIGLAPQNSALYQGFPNTDESRMMHELRTGGSILNIPYPPHHQPYHQSLYAPPQSSNNLLDPQFHHPAASAVSPATHLQRILQQPLSAHLKQPMASIPTQERVVTASAGRWQGGHQGGSTQPTGHATGPGELCHPTSKGQPKEVTA